LWTSSAAVCLLAPLKHNATRDHRAHVATVPQMPIALGTARWPVGWEGTPVVWASVVRTATYTKQVKGVRSLPVSRVWSQCTGNFTLT
jgi:hypothetical protein